MYNVGNWQLKNKGNNKHEVAWTHKKTWTQVVYHILVNTYRYKARSSLHDKTTSTSLIKHYIDRTTLLIKLPTT